MLWSTKPNTSATADLVDELLEVASSTDGGAAASTDQREHISQLVRVSGLCLSPASLSDQHIQHAKAG